MVSPIVQLCHVLQHKCRFEEAVRYTHNWWHVAVCYLEVRLYVTVKLKYPFSIKVYINALGFADEVCCAEIGYFCDLFPLSRLARMNMKKQRLMQRGLTSILLAQALYEYGTGNDAAALTLLGLDFDACDYKVHLMSSFDVFNDVWHTLLLKTGNATTAVDIMEKRLKIREGVPFLWHILEKACLMLGRQEAASATEKAVFLENAYFKLTDVAASA
ncbi:hypothetical protein Nepgr_003513 [Nepenthes gracilis]|uniref:Uncharacterized protein n=1 Tax=Nepenthes gracilis TaxID=150966 RepID=A0AAD3RZM7_NEPGR|nr:hypothetical protein Nepgr_003513 [Nepenthes gracilis]